MNMFKVVLNGNKLSFSLIDNINETLDFVNSNNLYNNTLLYSYSYVQKSVKQVENTIVNIVDKYAVNRIYFDTNYVADVFSQVLINTKTSIDVVVNDKVSIEKSLVKKLVNINNLKSVKCYFMPENYVVDFAKRGISVYFTFDGEFKPEFISANNLSNMKDMYFRRNIKVNAGNIDDFKLFLTINKFVKVIHVYDYRMELLNSILELVGESRCNILIHQNEDNLQSLINDLKILKNINKSYNKKTKAEIRIVYSDDYVKNNLFKQLTYSNLKLCSIIILYLGFIMFISNYYNDYVTWFNTKMILNFITSEVESTDILVDLPDNSSVTQEKNEENEDVNPYAGIPNQNDKLLKINNDTVGWIQVNNTKINYPVTQSGDNDYYLNRDFYKNRTANGWIFMDYRNNPSDLDKNTIIYGHSLLSGYMFGDLHNLKYGSWYGIKNNLTITFNTLHQELKWQIFSIYRTEYTTDYLKVNFYNDEAFINFVDLLKERSIYNFGVDVEAEDKILTLSTCGNNNSRMVVHAKLVK